jgi:hypothetical protein
MGESALKISPRERNFTTSIFTSMFVVMKGSKIPLNILIQKIKNVLKLYAPAA